MEEEKKDIQVETNQALGDTVINLTPTPEPVPVEPTPVVEAPVAPAPVEPVMAAPEVAPAAPTVEPTPVDPTMSQPQEMAAPVEKPKKKKPIIPIICVIVLLLVAGGFGLYKYVLNNPYESAITTMFKSLHDKNKLYSDTYKTVLNLKAEALADEYKELEKYKLSYNMTSDVKSNKFLINVDASTGEDTNVKANVYYADDKIYFKLDDLDKTYYMDLKELTESETKIEINEEDVNFLIDKFESAAKVAFKDEKRQSESKTVTVKGKEEKLTNKYYIIDSKNSARVVRNFVSEFNNDETIKKIAKMTGSDAKDIKEMIEYFATMEDSTDSEITDKIKFGVYTRGLFDSYAGINIAYNDTEILSYVEDGDYFTLVLTFGEFAFTMEGDNSTEKLEAKAVSGGETFFTLNYDGKSKSNNLVIEFPKQFKVVGDFYIEDKATIGEFNTKDAVNVEEMTEEEQDELSDKYYEMLGIDPSSMYGDSFKAYAEELFKEVTTQYVQDSAQSGEKEMLYGSECENQLDTYSLDDYLIKFDDAGKVVKFYYSDFYAGKSIKYEGSGLKLEDIGDLVDEYDESIDFTCK